MAKRWYIVHAYSNFEKKVADAIKEQAAAQGLDDLFDEVLLTDPVQFLPGVPDRLSTAEICAYAPEEIVRGLDLEQIDADRRESICNSAGQAELLNDAETDLNVICGLCVGHDAVFSMRSRSSCSRFQSFSAVASRAASDSAASVAASICWR